MRLDPLALPVHFMTKDANADERTRFVELDRDRVVLRRAVRGIRMAVNVPVRAFSGVAIRLLPAEGEVPAAAAVTLEHRDPALSVPLFIALDNDDVFAEWQLWARVLDRPLLVADLAGHLSEPFPQLGTLRLGRPGLRRRRRSPLHRRRPSIVLRRRPGRAAVEPLVHRDEREIIARD